MLKAIILTSLYWMGAPVSAQVQRVLGLDISAWQENISQTTWNNIRNVENRQFVILRSSRGGTTGYYNQNDANNTQGLNTFSQRYDDPYYVQNINRATAAGIFAGSYHFSRPDIIESTLNSGGVRNSGADEADHFIQMAGPWMRPGYLVPVHDFEAGDGIRTDQEMAQFCIDFSNRIYERMGIRPAIYINGNYAAFVVGGASAALRSQLAQQSANPPNLGSPAYPTLWSARWPNQSAPNSIDVQNGEPKDSYASIYGPWDDYGVTHPWAFWQYASTLRLQSYNNGGSNLDADVARGGIEFLKDQLIPAVWVNDSDGQWTTLANWNCGQMPVAPATGPGQVPAVGTQTLPTPRLPGGAGAGVVTSGTNDTVILDRPNANITVTLSSGIHNIRKLYMREALNITGGSLTVNYVPSPDSTTNAAQFSGPVTLSNSSFSVHTLQVDAGQTFTLSGATLSFNTISLMPGATPGKIALSGDIAINAPSNATATVAKGNGTGNPGSLDLGGGERAFNVGNGTAEVDLSMDVVVNNGGLTKTGAGTMRLKEANSYSGGTMISAGRLLVNNTTGSGTGLGSVVVNGGVLGGTGSIAGAVTVNSSGTIAPGTESAPGTLKLNNSPSFAGTTYLRIDRNGGAPVADRILVLSGPLNFGGSLVVSNVGAPLIGGEAFSIFSAQAYAGVFSILSLPSLNPGLNWDTNGLLTTGVFKVNRSPVAGLFRITNEAPNVLQIPVASLVGVSTDADGDAITLSGVNLVSAKGVEVLANDTYITYSNYVSVVDQIQYTLSDGHGGSAGGTVQIAASPTGRFAGKPTGDMDSVTLKLVGSPDRTYFLERSTNLTTWASISTNVAPANGLFDYTDDFSDLPAPPGSSFYRLRWAW